MQALTEVLASDTLQQLQQQLPQSAMIAPDAAAQASRADPAPAGTSGGKAPSMPLYRPPGEAALATNGSSGNRLLDQLALSGPGPSTAPQEQVGAPAVVACCLNCGPHTGVSVGTASLSPLALACSLCRHLAEASQLHGMKSPCKWI